MLAFLADENLNNAIIKGLRLLIPEIDIVRVQDTEIAEANDPTVLDFALQQNRVLLTHDLKTIPPLVFERLNKGVETPGIILIGQNIPVKIAIDDLQLIAVCTELGEWIGKTDYLPLPNPANR